MSNKLFWCWIIWCCWPGAIQAQTDRAGQVLDQATGAPLPFATVIWDRDGQQGLTADINGHFRLPPAVAADSLLIRFIGYAPLTVALPRPWPAAGLPLRLQAQALDLQPLEIPALRNPALRIMRLAIANRKRHDPARLAAYQCEIYNKSVFDWLPTEGLTAVPDSQQKGLLAMADYMALMVMEAVSLRQHRRPQGAAETVLSTRISGFQSPSFASLASDYQPFSFYDAQIAMLDETYLNPLAPGSLLRYHVRLDEQLIYGADTVFIIAFRPKAAFQTKGLTGQLHIHSSGYALQSVIAAPAQPGLISQRIEQRYRRYQDSIWFPDQLNVVLEMPHYPLENMGMQMKGRSYIRAVNLQPDLRKRDIALERVRMTPDAAMRRDSSYWRDQRVETLTLREQRTYQMFDSLGEEKDFDQYLRLLEYATQNRIPIGPVDIDLDKFLAFNEFEGTRLGLGLHTRQDRWERLRIGGYVAYGLRDRRWKFGGDLVWRIWPQQDVELHLGIQDDVEEPGQSRLGQISNARRFVGARMDHIQTQHIETRFRLGRSWQIRTGVHRVRRDPIYPYRWQAAEESTGYGPFSVLEWRTQLRFAYGEEWIESIGQRISQGSRYPILTVGHQRGLALGDADLRFDRLEAGIDWNFQIGALGRTRLRLQGGHLFGDAPAPWLFHGAGAVSDDVFIWVPGYFQTMRPYAFLQNTYAHALVEHNLGSPWRGNKWTRPAFRLTQGYAWGRWRDQADHAGILAQDLSQGYWESGLIVDQLLRADVANLLYAGLGGGGFVQWGPYAAPTWPGRIFWKISLTFSAR